MKYFKWLSLLLVIGSLLTLVLWAIFTEIPRLKKMAKSWLENQISQQTPFTAEIQNLSLHLFPIGVSLKNFDMKPKTLGSPGLPKIISFEHAKLHIAFIDLLKGKVSIEEFLIEGLIFEMSFADTPKTKASKINLKPLFKLTPFLEGAKLVINRANIELNNLTSDLDLSLLDTDLLVTIESQNIRSWIQLPEIKLHYLDKTTVARSSLHTVVTQDSINIENFELGNAEVQLRSKANITNLPDLLLNPNIQGDMTIQIIAQSPSTLLEPFNLSLGGQVNFESQFHFKDWSLEASQSRLQTQNFSIDRFQIGDLVINSQFKNNILTANKTVFNNHNINLELTDIKLGYLQNKDFIQLETGIHIHKLELQNLLQNLGLRKVPVWLEISGKGQCQGEIYPNFQLRCPADLRGENLVVKNSSTAQSAIVGLNHFGAQGHILINSKEVEYEAQLSDVHNSAKGISKGTIHYKHGFDIAFEGEELDFKKIGAISGLNFEGLASVKGSTKGNSSTATFRMTTQVSDFKFEGLNLGLTNANLRYAEGLLSFEDLKSQIGNSTLDGILKLELLKSQIHLNIATNKISGDDLMKLFDHYLPEKFLAQGEGSLRFSSRGPFDWRKWNTQLDLKFSKPLLFNEYFDELNVQFITQDQFIKIGPSFALKGPHRVVLSGRGNLESNSEINLSINNLPIEYIDNISLLSASVSGILNFQGRLINPLGNLQWFSQLDLSALTLNEQALDTIRLNYSDSDELRTINFEYGQQQLKSNLTINKNLRKVSELKATAVQFDARPLFTLIGASALVEDYESNMSFDLNYQFNRGEMLRGTGSFSLSNLFISRLGTELKLKEPGLFRMLNGELNFGNIKMQGSSDQSLEFAAEGLLYKNLKLSIQSDVELQLFHPFAPFLDDFRGRLVSNLILIGIPTEPRAFGQLRLEKGQMQFKGLPQSLNNIQLQSRFKGQELELLSFSGELGQGLVSGKGLVRYQDFGNVVVNIPVTISNSIIEPSDGVRIKTNGNLTLIGSWFPYLIEGNLNISEGLISKDFESSDAVLIKRSSLLPKMILKKAFDPIALKVEANSQPIQLRNTLIEGFASGQIEVTGSPTLPKIKGDIRIQENSRVLFREHEFRVEQGLVTLDGSADINPSLLFTALARIDRYDVTLNVQGTVENPIIRLSSQPILPEPDLVSLLALGQVTSEVERRLQTPSSQTQAEAQIGAVLLQNIPLFKKAQKAAGVNVQISSGFDPEQNAEFRRISVSKRLNNKTRVVAATGDYGFREFKLEYSLTNNLSAIGRFKQQDFIPNSINLERQNRADSILGLDLEFRREFR